MSQSIDREVLAARFKLREKDLASIEQQFNRLDEKLAALEARLPKFDNESEIDSIRRRKPR